MSQLPINGDIKALSNKQLTVINNSIQELKFKGCEVNIELLGKAGDNFASAVKKIKIKTSETETFNIIVKLNPNIGFENAMKLITSILFNNEITIYEEVLPMMVNYQKTVGVPKEELLKYPSCYGTSREKGDEVILLEDLSTENYTMLDKFEPLTHDTIKLILSDLARFHSLSYALKNSQPEIFSQLLKKLTDLYEVEEFKSHQKGLAVLIEKFTIIFDEQMYKNIIMEIIKDHSKNISKLVQSDTGSKYTVITHGDTWTNNILFKLKDGIPEKCILIDYQISRESLPVSDILYLVFNCTDYSTRKKHFYEWIDYYHSELENYLFNLGLKIANVYPRDKLDSDLKRYTKVNLGYSAIVLSILLRQAKEASVLQDAMTRSDMNAFNEVFFNFDHLEKESVLKIKERLEGLIDSCIDFGYLSTKL